MKKLNVVIPISNQPKENKPIETVTKQPDKNDVVHNENIDKFLYEQYSLMNKNKLSAYI